MSRHKSDEETVDVHLRVPKYILEEADALVSSHALGADTRQAALVYMLRHGHSHVYEALQEHGTGKSNPLIPKFMLAEP